MIPEITRIWPHRFQPHSTAYGVVEIGRAFFVLQSFKRQAGKRDRKKTVVA